MQNTKNNDFLNKNKKYWVRLKTFVYCNEMPYSMLQLIMAYNCNIQYRQMYIERQRPKKQDKKTKIDCKLWNMFQKNDHFEIPVTQIRRNKKFSILKKHWSSIF